MIFLLASDVETLDFSNVQEATNVINAWCANATKNHITDIISAGLYAQNYFNELNISLVNDLSQK